MISNEAYAERIKTTFDEFINEGFINYSPWEKSDEEVINDAHQRSTIFKSGELMNDCQSFASIYTFEECKELEYNGCYFDVLYLKPFEGNHIMLFNSDFHYFRSLDKSRCKGLGFGYNPHAAIYINTINDEIKSPQILSKGQQILVGYEFGTVNKFDKRRICYRLYTLTGNKSNDAEIIRRQILRAKAFTLLMLVKYPFKGAVFTASGICSTYYDIAEEELGRKEVIIHAKLSEIETELQKRGITYESDID